MILFDVKNDGTVKTVPMEMAQGSTLADLVVIAEAEYALVTMRLVPPSGLYIPDVIFARIKVDGAIMWKADLPADASITEGAIKYQIFLTDATGEVLETPEGRMTIPKGVLSDMPETVEHLKQYTINELYTLLSGIHTEMTAVDTRLDATEEDTKNLSETVDELDVNVGGLRSDVQGLDRAMEETSGRVDSLGVWLGDLDNEVKDIDAYCTELEESVADLNLRISMHSFTIRPDQWSDVDPYQAFNSVYIANLGSRSATLLLVPLTPETRAEARKTELSVDYTYSSSELITVWMTRTEYVPTITMYFAVVVVTSTKQVPGGYSYAASFVGVAELPDELMSREVMRVVNANTDTIVEAVLAKIPNGEEMSF